MTQQWDEVLPETARARMQEIRQSNTWGSALSTEEFAAIKGVGFDPVGQVLGTAVYHIGYAGRWGCSGAWTYNGGTEVSSSAWAPFSELVRTMYGARRLALARAVAECKALGGDGIVGVKLRVGHFPAGGMEFTALGTAVRARATTGTTKPFTSHVTGQEFAKLVHAGYVPTGLALGISIATRHDDWRTYGQLRWTAGNQEIDGYTQLINHARHDARDQLQRDAQAHGGDGVVVDEIDLRIRERECPSYENQRDHIAEAVFVGTSIARFERSTGPSAGPRPLTIMKLNRES
ncbi:MAG: heavy metal-binding domain-containing protein [Actinocrinis sp.]